MKVADVMTRWVISIAPTDSMSKAARLMLRYEMSGFPVMSIGRRCGCFDGCGVPTQARRRHNLAKTCSCMVDRAGL